MWATATAKKTGLWFSPVQSYVYFQSCRLDLRTLSQDDDGELSASEIVKANPKDGHFDTVVVLTAADAESTAPQDKFKLWNKVII